MKHYKVHVLDSFHNVTLDKMYHLQSLDLSLKSTNSSLQIKEYLVYTKKILPFSVYANNSFVSKCLGNLPVCYEKKDNNFDHTLTQRIIMTRIQRC